MEDKERKRKKQKADKRRILVSILAAFLVLLMLLPMVTMIVQTAFAATTSELEKQIKAGKAEAASISEKMKQINADLKRVQGDKAQAVTEKKLIDKKVAAKEAEIQNTQGMIAQLDELVVSKEGEVAETQAKEDAQYVLFCSRVRAMEELGTVSYWDILLGARDFTDLLDRTTLIGEVMDYDNSVIEDLAATRALLAEQQSALEADRAEQQVQKDALVAQKNDLDGQLSAAASLVSKMQSQEAEYAASLAEQKAEEARVDKEIAKRQKELAAKIAAGTVTFDAGTGWQWPLPGNTRISSVMGGRNHPVTGKVSTHQGVDIPAPRNTPIHAAAGGVVTISALSSSYGNYVVVQHKDGMSTLYAHMNSRAVSEGDVVAQNQTLGYVGSTGLSTGNHLHLEFRKGGTRKDPLSTLYPSISFRY